MSKGMMYKGKLLTEYSREDLVQIIEQMYEMYEARLANLREGLHTLKKS